jgi:effector-binding domain-containing protein
MNISEPKIVERSAQPYVAIKRTVGQAELGEVLPPLWARVFEWVGTQGIAPQGAFWKYNVIDMERQLEVEVGEQVGAAVDGDGDIVAGVLPGGRYATLRHVGHPQELAAATTAVLDWASEQGLAWDKSEVGGVEHWASRLELYHTDPTVEADMTKWETTLAFRLAD